MGYTGIFDSYLVLPIRCGFTALVSSSTVFENNHNYGTIPVKTKSDKIIPEFVSVKLSDTVL
jgi:hypothetical protein